ncbi:peptidoglycan-binding domain-containing protein [Catellatospora sichuanensis]|uniref:peptidoglycan-binding domain-containing protein n=1 Tax=Catellatospora sichuanensis TaxID=1969805 RepID=UPI00118370CB|nr:peptidoglycan-binding domain-containing protein [Catellatospora sichuanensis]
MTARFWRTRAATTGLSVAVLALLAVGVAAALGLGGGSDPPADRRTGPAATTKVTRQTLVEAITVAGTLGYGPATPVTSNATGTVTWLPAVGATVRRGGQLLRADDLPVLLLYGPLPMYRPLGAGVVGADVMQFEQNLAALGLRGFEVDDTFSPATATAVKRWQKSLDLPQTGSIDRDRVIYASGPVRISAQLVRVGASATGDILQYTGSTRVVTATADRSKAGWAVPGAKVNLSPHGGTPTPGTVTTVTDAQPAAGTESSGANVTITIAYAAQQALGTQNGAGVTIRYIVQERRDVLTVPVNALLALAEGGYGVEVVTDRARIVAVQVGLFSDGRVEISAAGIDNGTTVGIPA